MSAEITTLAARIVGKPLRRRISIMAKARVSTNPLYKGGAGGYTFYVREGEQIVRQRKNNSNYGDTASRTRPQMIRRIMWGNLVNVFKSMKSWQPKAYDSKKQGQTDYNIYMSLNINRATAGTLREMNESGCCIIEPYQISRGSLPPVDYSVDSTNAQVVTNIASTLTIGNATTIGDLSADIIEHNPLYQAGDNIAFIFFRNWMEPRVEWPYARTIYAEITLDTTSTALVKDIPNIGSKISVSTGGYLQFSYVLQPAVYTNKEVGFAAIHTRKNASALQVSSQNIVMMDTSIIQQYSGEEWYEQCIFSYGLTEEVPLDPSFPKAPIVGVTANGEPIQNAQVLTGSQVIKLLGEDIDEGSLSFEFDGIPYTPLLREESSLGYIVGNNGSVTIRYAGRVFMSFRVEGVVVPAGLPTRIAMSQSASTTSGGVNLVAGSYDCLNYPYMASDEYRYFVFSITGSNPSWGDADINDFEGHNCTIQEIAASSENQKRIAILVVDEEEPAWLTYQDFIVAVFNYSE